MDSPFAFDKVAAGDGILGRESKIREFCDTIRNSRKGVSLATGPKSGKETVVREGLERLRKSGFSFALCEMNLFNVRNLPDFIETFKKSMMQCLAEINRKSLIPFEFNLDSLPPRKLFELPARIAEDLSGAVIIYVKEFQNLLSVESGSFKLDDLDRIWSKQTGVIYILTGSFINSMKLILEQRRLFSTITRQIELEPLDRKTVCEYIISTFLNVGRVIESEEALAIYEISGGNMWYVKQICSVCQGMPVGYINRKIVNTARDSVISVYSSHFMYSMLDLTTNQINLLKAIIDGAKRFSSLEVMEHYQLNSSANVARIKDALQKREIVTFNRNDDPCIIDPLFRYWLKNHYFAK